MGLQLTTADVLNLWHDVHLALVRDDEPDLSARQISILLTVYLEAPPHTVRDLAARLNVSKPVITRALDTMGKMGLVSRRRDDKDRRNVLIQRTDPRRFWRSRQRGERLADQCFEIFGWMSWCLSMVLAG